MQINSEHEFLLGSLSQQVTMIERHLEATSHWTGLTSIGPTSGFLTRRCAVLRVTQSKKNNNERVCGVTIRPISAAAIRLSEREDSHKLKRGVVVSDLIQYKPHCHPYPFRGGAITRILRPIFNYFKFSLGYSLHKR